MEELIKETWAENQSTSPAKSSREYLEKLTQRVFTQCKLPVPYSVEHIYKCLDCIVYPTNNLDDEYVVVVLEIMDEVLRKFYGGSYIIQQWIKKKKIFQKVHKNRPNQFFQTGQRFIYSLKGFEEECKWIYITNHYQQIFQKIRHPFFSEENADGYHDSAVYVDPKCVIISQKGKMNWGPLRIEEVIELAGKQMERSPDKSPSGASGLKSPIEERSAMLEIHESQISYLDVMENMDPEGKPDDIVRIFDVNNEGFSRKLIQLAVERIEDISIYQLNYQKVVGGMGFQMELLYEFKKSRINFANEDKIVRMTLENVADTENVLAIQRVTGDIRVMSEKILALMNEYDLNRKLDEGEDEGGDDEGPRNLFERVVNAIFGAPEDEPLLKKNKPQDLNQLNSLMGQLDSRQVNFYFTRRNLLYLEMVNGDVRRLNIQDLKDCDALSKASKLQVDYQEAVIQDVALHVGFFQDFLIANTTLIISHGKILSILDFQRDRWNHMLPQQQDIPDDETLGESYFGVPPTEIQQLLLNYVFSDTIYDCIIMYRGQFIRRLKYYNDLNKTFLERGQMFGGLKVLQMMKNQDIHTYRKYGDDTGRAFFLLEDERAGEQQLWMSDNGSKLTKLIEGVKDNWRLLNLPNAPIDTISVFSLTANTLTFYCIRNMSRYYREREIEVFKQYQLHNFYQFDNQQFFLFGSYLYFNNRGNLMCVNLAEKNKAKAQVEINFDYQIQELCMPNQETVYYKDRRNFFRIVNLKLQKEFDAAQQPSEIFQCKGAFLDKIIYGFKANRLAVFNSPFNLSIIPCLDRCSLDMLASGDFHRNFICYKEVANKIIALKKPNELVTWDWDTGKVVGNVVLEDQDFERQTKHSEWNGQFLLKRKREVWTSTSKKSSKAISRALSIVDEEELQDSANFIYTLLEIQSSSKVVEHCWFEYENRLGLTIYVASPYVLAMDDAGAKMFLLEGAQNKKSLKPLRSFFDAQMKVGSPMYFSPNFLHRVYIDSGSKRVVVNHTLTNRNILSVDLKKQLMFQKKKTHPMIYFHDDDQLVYLTHQGIEKVVKIAKIPAGWFSKARVELQDVSTCYHNEEAFLRRFMLDPQNFNEHLVTQMTTVNLLKFRADLIQRDLKLNVFRPERLFEKVTDMSRFSRDKNVSSFNNFVLGNLRRQMSFSYFSWTVMESLQNRKLKVEALSKQFLEELCFTILADQSTVLHFLQANYNEMTELLSFAKEDPDEIVQNTVSISDLPFLPNLAGNTPIHDSMEQNNTSVIDLLLLNFKDAAFDHHARYLAHIYHQLLEAVPQSMCIYLDSRLISPIWVQEYTRGRVEVLPDTDLAINTFSMWDSDLRVNIDKKLLNTSDVTEQPLNVYVFDIPDVHKYLNQNADNILEALASTEQIQLFDCTSVRSIIEMKWPIVRKGIVKKLFIPYLIFLVAFLIYSIYIFENYYGWDNYDVFDAEGNKIANATAALRVSRPHLPAFPEAPIFSLKAKGGASDLIANTTEDIKDLMYVLTDPNFWESSQKAIFKTLILILATYFLLIESRQLVITGPFKYLSSPWNYIDIIPLGLIYFSFTLEFFIHAPVLERPLNAVICFFMWIKFLYFFRIFRQTSKFISMIEEIIKDMKDFLVVFFITMFGFSQGMMIISNSNKDYSLPEENWDDNTFISSLFNSLQFAYLMSLGDFDTGSLGVAFYWLALIFFIVATLFLTIMMLNLLIAVISSTYERVRDTSVSQMYKTMADLTVENEYLVPDSNRVDHDARGDYLYLAMLDQTGSDELSGAAGSIEEIRKIVMSKSVGMSKGFAKAQTKLMKQLNSSNEKLFALLTEANLKNELRVKQVMRKLDINDKNRPSGDRHQRMGSRDSPQEKGLFGMAVDFAKNKYQTVME